LKIGLDLGHGGRDPGAVDPVQPEQGDHLYSEEKTIVLPIGLEVKRLLEAAGHEVVMTRTSDETLSLPQRTKILNDAKCDIAVSIHVNSSTSSTPNYIATLIQSIGGQAEKIAKCVQSRLVQATGWPDGGIKVANLHMTRETKMPAVLVELGFLSNPEQERQLADPAFRLKLAQAIASGILEYIGEPLRTACIIDIKGKQFPGYIAGGRTYFNGVPVREVTEALSPQLEWDSKNLTVKIT
jgi:N-acetylmuramoyl-L-alanine amidase